MHRQGRERIQGEDRTTAQRGLALDSLMRLITSIGFVSMLLALGMRRPPLRLEEEARLVPLFLGAPGRDKIGEWDLGGLVLTPLPCEELDAEATHSVPLSLLMPLQRASDPWVVLLFHCINI
jgi:hypothetical protein